MYVTYILISKVVAKTYIGHTNDLERRILEHNAGKSTFSKRYKPWVLLYKEEFKTNLEAIAREKYLKSAAGRRFIKKILFADVVKW